MRQKTLAVLSLLVATTFLTGCGGDMVLLNSAGPVAEGLSYLMMLSIYVMLGVVIPTIFMSIYFAWKYRKANKDADYQPNWAHSTIIEIVVWGIPIAIIAFLATVAYKGSHEYDPYKSRAANPADDMIIQVIAEQFKWVFIYPEQKIATINEVRFPEKQPISFRITSNFTMGSFFIPKLAGQIYAMAGMQTRLHMIADTTGNYRGFAANVMGYGHSQMRFRAISVTKPEFDTWVSAIQSGQGATYMVDNGWGKQVPAIQKGLMDMNELKAIRDHNRSKHQVEALIKEAERTGNDEFLKLARIDKNLPAEQQAFPTSPAPVTYYSSADTSLFDQVINSYASNPDNKPVATQAVATQHAVAGE